MCLGSGFADVPVRSDNEPAVLALKESAATVLKLSGVTLKTEESALYDSQRNGLAESTGKDVKDGVRTNLVCLFGAFGQELCRKGPKSKAAYGLRKERKFGRAPPLCDRWGREGCGENLPWCA